MRNTLDEQNTRPTMISRGFCLLVLLTLARTSVADTEHVLRIKKQFAEDDQSRLMYHSQDDSIPLLSQEFILLKKVIDELNNGTCKNQFQTVLNGLRNLTSWAVKFYDASAKLPTGLQAGSVYQLGNFDECLDLGSDDWAPSNIRGQYCLSEIEIEVPEIYLKKNGTLWNIFRDSNTRDAREPIKKLYWGICTPAGCTAKDVEGIIRKILALTFNDSHLKLTASVSERSCYRNEFDDIDTKDIIYVCVILFIILVIFGCTVFHGVWLWNKGATPNGTLAKSLINFSLIFNMKKLFSVKKTETSHLNCINGIKFISMIFIVASHSLLFVMGSPIFNINFYEQAIQKVQYSIFLNNPLLVDTFLMLSGFLSCNMIITELHKKKSINFLALYIVRYIRLTPVYFIIIGFYTTWLTQLDRGPFWSIMRREKENCLNSWWLNLLYINNYVDTDKLCMFQSWYLAVDTQLFILAPAIIYPLWRWRKVGKYLLFGTVVISIVIPFVVTLLDEMDPTILVYAREVKDITTNSYFINAYIKTHMRAVSYCIGLLFGYIAYRIQADEYKLSKKFVKIGNSFAAISLVASLCSLTIFYTVKKDFTVLDAAIYSPLHRLFWCIGIGLIIILCITDNAGLIRNFLEHKVCVIFGRLTYSAYLLNGLIELHSKATVRSPYFLNVYLLVSVICWHVMFTFTGAIVLTILFESPLHGLQQMLLRKNISVKKINTEMSHQQG